MWNRNLCILLLLLYIIHNMLLLEIIHLLHMECMMLLLLLDSIHVVGVAHGTDSADVGYIMHWGY